ncbi:MAG: phosphoglycerate mutase, partial [Simplicispira sp.]|nr:phosphoglycerate mutase [Simplicispira sp.]
IPYAAAQSALAQQALASLALPHLDRLLAQLSPAIQDEGDEESLSLPHERALARALGLPGEDGHLAWAAWHVAQLGTAAPAAPPDAAWAFITPCHWQVRTDHVTLDDPAALALDEANSRALLAVLAPWFEQDGITLHYDQPTRWLAHGEVFADLACASLDRVLHRDVRAWMQGAQQHAVLNRLHSEMQMLLYTHAWTQARQAQGQPLVNAFWVHGAGRRPLSALPCVRLPQMPLQLRGAALHEDWSTWTAAWQALDAGPIAQLAAQVARGGTAQLTLCGERSALSWHTAPRSLRERIAGVFRPQRFASVRDML